MYKLCRPFILWLTGLPCSGKTTLAQAIKKEFLKNGHFSFKVLDGDEFRSKYSKGLGFSIEDRHTNNLRIANKAIEFTKEGDAVVVAIVSAYRETRKEVKKVFKDLVEVYVKCSVEVCEQRDTKGMYKQARENKIEHFTGVNDPYEEPLNPDIRVETHKQNLEECLETVIKRLEELNYISNKKN
jgi:adenylyl-sulfate kinase